MGKGKPRSVVGTLKAARALVARPRGWTQGSMWETRSGECYDDCPKHAPAKVCALGALSFLDGPAEHKATSFVRMALPPAWAGASIWQYNDSSETTHADVIALFDRAIKLARAKK